MHKTGLINSRSLRLSLAAVGRLLAEEQRHFMAASGQEIGEFGTQPAGGKIRETAHVIHRFVSRPRGDNTLHNFG